MRGAARASCEACRVPLLSHPRHRTRRGHTPGGSTMSNPTPAQQATTKGILGVLDGTTSVDQAIANIDEALHDPTPKDVQTETATVETVPADDPAAVAGHLAEDKPKRAPNRKARNAE